MTTSVPESDPVAALGFKWEAAEAENARVEDDCGRRIKSARPAEDAIVNEIARTLAQTAPGLLVQMRLLKQVCENFNIDELDPFNLLLDPLIEKLLAGLEALAVTDADMGRAQIDKAEGQS